MLGHIGFGQFVDVVGDLLEEDDLVLDLQQHGHVAGVEPQNIGQAVICGCELRVHALVSGEL